MSKWKLIWAFIKKSIKWIELGVIAVLVGVIAIFAQKNAKLKAEVKASQAESTSWEDKYNAIAAQEAIVVSVTLNNKNYNVLGITNNSFEEVAKTVAVYTRSELVDLLDSLNNK